MITLIALRHLEIDGHVVAHGCEVQPGRLAQATIDRLIDQGSVREYDSKDRRSLFRLFSKFSDCDEQEHLTEDELDSLGLPE
jgi:hypothetical protein